MVAGRNSATDGKNMFLFVYIMCIYGFRSYLTEKSELLLESEMGGFSRGKKLMFVVRIV